MVYSPHLSKPWGCDVCTIFRLGFLLASCNSEAKYLAYQNFKLTLTICIFLATQNSGDHNLALFHFQHNIFAGFVFLHLLGLVFG